MRILVWLFRAFIFFALFAFALNNQQTATVHWFFGVHWDAPLVIVVLTAFAAGSAFGVLAMVPSWWRHRRRSAQAPAAVPATASPPTSPTTTQSDFGPEFPPREGL